MTHVYAYQSYVGQWPTVVTMPRENGRQSGVRSYIVPGLPTHLEQVLNTGTVEMIGKLLYAQIFQGV